MTRIAISEAWFEYVSSMLWQSSVVMLAVWFLYALCWKRSAAVRYALLCLILLKFLLPTSLHSVTGIGHWIGGWGSPVEAPVASPGFFEATPPFELGGFETLSTSLPSAKPSGAPFSAPIPERRAHLPSRLFLAWISGALLLGTLLLVHALRIRKRFSSATRVEEATILDLLEDCHKKVGVSRPVPLYRMAGLTSPILAGLFRPRILVSPETLDHMSERHLRPILLHELAHAKRRDLLVNAFQIVLQAIWFFHPGLWLTNWLIRRERERACDDLVLEKMGGAGRDYADSILRVLKENASPRFATVGLLGIAERGASLKDRIRRILDTDRKFKVRVGATGAISLLVLGAVLLPMAKGEVETTAPAAVENESTVVTPIPAETERVLDPGEPTNEVEFGAVDEGERTEETLLDRIQQLDLLLRTGTPDRVEQAGGKSRIRRTRKAYLDKLAELKKLPRTAEGRASLPNSIWFPEKAAKTKKTDPVKHVEPPLGSNLRYYRVDGDIRYEYQKPPSGNDPILIYTEPIVKGVTPEPAFRLWAEKILWSDNTQSATATGHFAVEGPDRIRIEAATAVVYENRWTSLTCPEGATVTKLDRSGAVDRSFSEIPCMFILDASGIQTREKLFSTGSSVTDEVLDAVAAADIATLKSALDTRPESVNVRNSSGQTPLILAARDGHREIVEHLLDQGAEVNATDHDGKNAWYHATFNHHSEIATLLIERGSTWTFDEF